MFLNRLPSFTHHGDQLSIVNQSLLNILRVVDRCTSAAQQWLCDVTKKFRASSRTFRMTKTVSMIGIANMKGATLTIFVPSVFQSALNESECCWSATISAHWKSITFSPLSPLGAGVTTVRISGSQVLGRREGHRRQAHPPECPPRKTLQTEKGLVRKLKRPGNPPQRRQSTTCVEAQDFRCAVS